MRVFKAIRTFIAKRWLSFALYGGLLAVVGWLLWWQLGSLTGGYSAGELATLKASYSLSGIYHNPVNAPFTLLVHALLYLPYNDLLLVRVAATLVALLTITVFYWLVRHWHGQRAAIFGTLVFGSSAWFLHTARLGTPDVLMFGLLALTACSVWFKAGRQALPVVLLLVLAAGFIYVPGMVWFIAAGVVWQWHTIDDVFKKHLWMVTLGGFLLLGILAPLGLAIYHTPSLGKEIIGLPAAGWPQPITTLWHIAEVPLRFVARGPEGPEHWLGHLAILDGFCLAMFALGVYVYAKHARLVRTQLVMVILLIGIALAGLNGPVSPSIVVPFLFIVIAAGIGLLMDRWYAVFPRNPIAQTVGVGAVCIVVLASCTYGFRHYFIAWPHSPSTKAVFVVRPESVSDTMKR